jgi:hypothetical protein
MLRVGSLENSFATKSAISGLMRRSKALRGLPRPSGVWRKPLNANLGSVQRCVSPHYSWFSRHIAGAVGHIFDV